MGNVKILEGEGSYIHFYLSLFLKEISFNQSKMEHSEMLIGRINFHIHRAENLPDRDMFTITDPFVTIEIDGEELFRTQIIEDRLNPVWDEHGSFNINKEVAEINFIVRDKDHIGSDFVGSVAIPVKDLFELKGTDEEDPGKLKFSVQYLEGETI